MSTGGLGSDLSVESRESGLGHSQAPRGSPFTPFPLSPAHQLHKVTDLPTHLVTLLSTFTWGTGRARKSLEARGTWISKEGCLVPQPPGGRSTRQTQRREPLRPGTRSRNPRYPMKGVGLLPLVPAQTALGMGGDCIESLVQPPTWNPDGPGAPCSPRSPAGPCRREKK